jgi:6-phosphogluconate dehydrogenase
MQLIAENTTCCQDAYKIKNQKDIQCTPLFSKKTEELGSFLKEIVLAAWQVTAAIATCNPCTTRCLAFYRAQNLKQVRACVTQKGGQGSPA